MHPPLTSVEVDIQSHWIPVTVDPHLTNRPVISLAVDIPHPHQSQKAMPSTQCDPSHYSVENSVVIQIVRQTLTMLERDIEPVRQLPSISAYLHRPPCPYSLHVSEHAAATKIPSSLKSAQEYHSSPSLSHKFHHSFLSTFDLQHRYRHPIPYSSRPLIPVWAHQKIDAPTSHEQ